MLYFFRIKNILVIVFCLFANIISAQKIAGSKSKISFQYFRVERISLGGNTPVHLNKHFGHIRPFRSDKRFSPDEPSSFSSLEYTFYEKYRPKTYIVNLAVGLFRNHIKGDFLFPENTVHFGKGNSQVGIHISGELIYPFLDRMGLGVFVQAGAGPHFSQWTGWEKEITPGNWGVRGAGVIANTGLVIHSPFFWKRWQLSGIWAGHFSASSYGQIEVKDLLSGKDDVYDKINFYNRIRVPRVSVRLSYRIKNE